MISSVVSTLIFSNARRKVMELSTSRLEQLWMEWDVRVMVLLSLTIQLLLSFCGNYRKYSNNVSVRFLVWLAYLTADSVAAYALGIISSNLADVKDNNDAGSLDANAQLSAFWTPILLLHLGGPDTVTAYSREDNTLWKRNLLAVAVQTVMSLYVLFMAWTGSVLSILSLLMFIPGLIKYGERTWVLRSASYYQKPTKTEEEKRQEFEKELDKMDDDEEPPMALFFTSTVNTEYHLNDYKIKEMEGYVVGVDRIVEVDQLQVNLSGCNSKPLSQEDKLRIAFGLLDTDKLLFVDAILDTRDRDTSRTVFRNLSFGDAFEVIDIELGSIYDWLYTKFPFLHTRWGIGLRFFSFFLTCSELVLFCVLIDKDKYSKVDVFITFILLAVAIMLDIYAAILLLFSDKFHFWLSNHNKTSTIKALSSFPLHKSPRWSNELPQYSLLNFMFKKKEKPILYTSMNIGIDIDHECCLLRFMINDNKEPCLSCKFPNIIGIDMDHQLWEIKVSKDLKKYIFLHVKQTAEKATRTGQVPFTALPKPGGKQNQDSDHGLIIRGTSIREDFAYNIVIWHIATEVLYYLLDREHISQELAVYCNSIKQLSRYMLYLLIEYPSMLSAETSQISFKEISDEAKLTTELEIKHPPWSLPETSENRDNDSSEPDKPDDLDEFEDVEASGLSNFSSKITNPEAPEESQSNLRIARVEPAAGMSCVAIDSEEKDTASKTKTCKQLLRHMEGFESSDEKSMIVLLEAVKLVKELNGKPQEKKWKRIGEVWFDILGYAARKSKVNEHAEQLRHGGELLTHVWLLLAHFGMTDHFQVTSLEEHPIVRLIAK